MYFLSLADDVVLCAREKDVLELELEQWMETFEKRGMKVSWAKTNCMCLDWAPLWWHCVRINLPGCHRSPNSNIWEAPCTAMVTWVQKYARHVHCGWNNWRKMSGVLCDKRVPPHVKGKIHKMIVQPAMLYGMETVPAPTWRNWKWQKWRCADGHVATQYETMWETMTSGIHWK